ncbi:MAG: MBL fold metallo-hydrolase [Saprospiraceae bacterium]|nr:MBL fold metallo-hydrolase [Saprospiraceae bacterium]
MTITLLGTGTSQGVPVIGCTCEVCTSSDPRDNRLRSSALITAGGQNILIDAGPDFRQQMLRARVNHLDAIILTHEHNDHVIGLDDVRPFNHRSGSSIDVFALPRVAAEVKKRFEYVFAEYIPGLPRIELKPVEVGSFISVGSVKVEPIGIMHGRLPIVGVRIGEFAYLTDVKTIQESEFRKLFGVKKLVINALHQEWHPTHLNLSEALEIVGALQPEETWLTHISHQMGLHADMEAALPPHVKFAYDGMRIDIKY